MSKTAAKQRVSAKRGFANGRGNLFHLREPLDAATHGTCGFVNGRPVNSSETIAAKGFYNSDYCSLYIHLYLC